MGWDETEWKKELTLAFLLQNRWGLKLVILCNRKKGTFAWTLKWKL
jgi:hypothetical protein